MSDLAKRGGELVTLLEKMGPAIAQALPKHISPGRIARIALTAVRSNYQLAQCTPQSFLGSLLQASQLGLEVNTPLGQAYLIPYKEVCTLVIGYQGMLDLARRSGMVKAIYAHPVFAGDEFSYELGLEPKLHHKPCDEPGDLTHVYAVARLTDGEPIFTVLTRKEVERYRARSMAKNNGPWVTDYAAMAQKTAIRRLFRWLPKSAEQALALAVDDADESRPQIEAFSPEVAGLLAEVPAPSPVPEGSPEGKRVMVMPGKKTKGAAAPVAQSEPPPVGSAESKAAAPEGRPKSDPPPKPIDPEELHELLASVAPEWSAKGLAKTEITGWTHEQRAQAQKWATAVAMNASMAEQAARPAHTYLIREPGSDDE